MFFMTANEYAEAARDCLPADIAEQLIGLLRRGCWLRPAEPGEVVACRLGGNPRMPQGVEWPEWPGHGPLTFIACVDCAVLSKSGIDLALPESGRLLFFYFDGQLDDGQAMVTCIDEESQLGARVIYVPEGVPVVEHIAPQHEGRRIGPYDEQALAAELIVSAPAFDVCGHYPDHANTFADLAVDLTGSGPNHRVGGYAVQIQNAVELDIAQDGPAPAGEWLLLAQFDTDMRSQMMWGDDGRLYWLITRQDLAERRFDRVRFTWQCS
jgi:uncharacterized protein YwqG